MTVTGYIRVSTDRQSNEHWRLMLTEYAHSKGLPEPEWIEETVSGKKPWKGRKLAGLLENSIPGDILIVGEASRIGRDAHDALGFLKASRKAGIVVHVVQAGQIITPDDDSINAELIIGILFQIAQYERRLLSYRVRLGLNRAKAEGKHLGGYRGRVGRKPGGAPVRADKDKILRAVRGGASINGASNRFGVARSTIYTWLKEVI